MNKTETLTPAGRYIDLYREHCGRDPTLNNQECEVINRLHAHAKRAGIMEAAARRSEVPVLPGEMPDEMLAAIQSDKDTASEALRIVVRQTLDEYEQAILRAAEEVKL